LRAADNRLQRPSAQTIRSLTFPQPLQFAKSAQSRSPSNPQCATWKKESIFFFPSSEAIHLSSAGAILLSGKA
jgi:hypothetical protein